MSSLRALSRSFAVAVAAMTVLSLTCVPGVFANRHSGAGGGNGQNAGNNVYIHHSLSLPKTQVFLLQDYANNINANSLIDRDTKAPITMRNPPNCYGPINTKTWYFMLGRNQTAQLTNYVATPFHFALWVPVDSSLTGQDPSTCWFQNTCFSYPATFGAPANALPAGATFVEFNVKNIIFDTVDISEVNGVNAQWSIELPSGWTNSAYRNAMGQMIAITHIENSPGDLPNFYGDYGNPGVYPFGCTNCASRYQNLSTPGSPPGTQRSGCMASDSLPPVPYPTNDVGCDNAINYYPTNANTNPPVPPESRNPPLAGYQDPPPGMKALPFDKFYDPQLKKPLFDIAKNPPIPFAGYGICEFLRGPAPLGGSFDITLKQYPFGQIQP